MHRNPYPTSKQNFVFIGGSGLSTSQVKIGRPWYLRNTNKTKKIFRSGDKVFPKR